MFISICFLYKVMSVMTFSFNWDVFFDIFAQLSSHTASCKFTFISITFSVCPGPSLLLSLPTKSRSKYEKNVSESGSLASHGDFFHSCVKSHYVYIPHFLSVYSLMDTCADSVSWLL